MIALIPALEASQAYLRPQARPLEQEFAQLLENVARRAPESAPPAAPQYTVQPGDNLSDIARKLGQADPYALARANGLKDPNLLRVGQVLQVPAGGVASAKAPALAAAPAAVRRALRPTVARPPAAAAAPNPVALPTAAGQVVTASWYGAQHHGRLMANGQPFNMYADTVAHPSLPLGTRLSLTNPENGRTVEVKVTDRGPFVRGRGLDLSYGVAQKLGVVQSGVSRLVMRKS